MDAIIDFTIQNNFSMQIFSVWRLILPRLAIFDPFDPPFDPWGAPKKGKYLEIDLVDNTIGFLIQNHISMPIFNL